MAKKNTSSRKPTEESNIGVGEVSTSLHETSASETIAAAAAADETIAASDETPLSKPNKSKVTEDQAATGSVSLSDIRKAVAFANSVGGLDKAIALLQIVKVAKEVQ